jgi:hypothetical protein
VLAPLTLLEKFATSIYPPGDVQQEISVVADKVELTTGGDDNVIEAEIIDKETRQKKSC